MNEPMVKSFTTTAEKLDDNLVMLQNKGCKISQIIPCGLSFDMQSKDKFKSQNMDGDADMKLAIVYIDSIRKTDDE